MAVRVGYQTGGISIERSELPVIGRISGDKEMVKGIALSIYEFFFLHGGSTHADSNQVKWIQEIIRPHDYDAQFRFIKTMRGYERAFEHIFLTSETCEKIKTIIEKHPLIVVGEFDTEEEVLTEFVAIKKQDIRVLTRDEHVTMGAVNTLKVLNILKEGFKALERFIPALRKDEESLKEFEIKREREKAFEKANEERKPLHLRKVFIEKKRAIDEEMASLNKKIEKFEGFKELRERFISSDADKAFVDESLTKLYERRNQLELERPVGPQSVGSRKCDWCIIL